MFAAIPTPLLGDFRGAAEDLRKIHFAQSTEDMTLKQLCREPGVLDRIGDRLGDGDDARMIALDQHVGRQVVGARRINGHVDAGGGVRGHLADRDQRHSLFGR